MHPLCFFVAWQMMKSFCDFGVVGKGGGRGELPESSEKRQIKLRACAMPHDAGVARDNSHFVACRNVRVDSVPFLGALTLPAR